jgi:hypothetical protein
MQDPPNETELLLRAIFDAQVAANQLLIQQNRHLVYIKETLVAIILIGLLVRFVFG